MFEKIVSHDLPPCQQMKPEKTIIISIVLSDLFIYYILLF